MGSPDPVISEEIADIPVHSELRHLAVEILAAAMAELTGHTEAPPAVIARAEAIVDATLDRAGRKFVVLVEGSDADARALVAALLTSSPNPRPVNSTDLAQAAAAISVLINNGDQV